MQKNDCYQLGSIVKKHGYKGEVKIRLDVDLPSFYSELEFFMIEGEKGLMPYFLEYIQLQKDGFAIAKIEGIDTEEDLVPFLRKEIYLPLANLPELTGNQFYYHDILGFTVIDASYGVVGLLEDIIGSGAQELFRVNSKGTEVLIPFTDDCFDRLEREKKELHIRAPEGLIELYLGSDGE